MALPRKTFGGTTFIIDRPKGTVKVWPQPDGGEKRFTYPCDYGYFPRLKGEDGEGLDAFVGDDPNGHYEVFQKLKPHDGGGMELDETKFLVGVSNAEREAIYRLYGDEIHARRVFRDMTHLRDALEKFQPKKKARYGVKTAAEEKEEQPGVLNDGAHLIAAAGLGGLAHESALGSAERVLGAQRLYHGTSDHAAKRIRRQGMLTSFGGGSTGSSAAINDANFLASSKGRIHVAKGPLQGLVTHPHASLAEAFKQTSKLDEKAATRAFLRGLLPGSPGSVVEAAVPYEHFLKHYEQDPDHLPGVAFRSNKSIPASQIRKGKTTFRDLWRARARHMGTYADRHAGRVLRGVGLGLGALGLGAGAVAMASPAVRRLHQAAREYFTTKEARLSKAARQVLARYKLSDLKQADIDKLIRGHVVAMPNPDRQTPAEEASIGDRLSRVFARADAKTQSSGEESSIGQTPIEGSVSL